MTKIVSASDLRENMAQILQAAAEEAEPQFITYRSRPIAVLMGYEHFEALMEQLEDLSDVIAIYERQKEPRRPFGEVLAQRERGEGTPHVQPVPAPAG